MLAARAVRAQRGPPSSGSPFLAYFFWRSKRSRSAAGTNPRLVPTTVQPQCVTRHQRVVLSLCPDTSNTAIATTCAGHEDPSIRPLRGHSGRTGYGKSSDNSATATSKTTSKATACGGFGEPFDTPAARALRANGLWKTFRQCGYSYSYAPATAAPAAAAPA